MKNCFYLLFSAVLLISINGCGEKEEEPSPQNNSGGGSNTGKRINIKVIDRYRINVNGVLVGKDSLLPGATAKLYRTSSDMNGDVSIGTAKTNNTGEASFNAGAGATGEFHVKAFHPKNSETAFQIVEINQNSVAVFGEIRMPL